MFLLINAGNEQFRLFLKCLFRPGNTKSLLSAAYTEKAFKYTQKDRFHYHAFFSFDLINQLKFNSNAFKHYEFQIQNSKAPNTKHDVNIWMRRCSFQPQIPTKSNCRLSLVAINNQKWMIQPTLSELNMAKYFWNFLNSEYGCVLCIDHWVLSHFQSFEDLRNGFVVNDRMPHHNES